MNPAVPILLVGAVLLLGGRRRSSGKLFGKCWPSHEYGWACYNTGPMIGSLFYFRVTDPDTEDVIHQSQRVYESVEAAESAARAWIDEAG